jgi:hypothetical protein
MKIVLRILLLKIGIFLCIPISGIAQPSVTAGFLPKINLTTGLNDRTRLNASAESRGLFYDKLAEKSSALQYILSDFMVLVSRSIGFSTSLNLGYTLRLTNGETIHRTIQQFNLVRNLDAGRLAHRFATDQTYSPSESPVFRVRYRITFERPLSGDEVDEKEFYFKMGNEYLGIYQVENSDLEIRLVPLFGYEINAHSKVEFGVDYRISEFLVSPYPESQLWAAAAWYWSF